MYGTSPAKRAVSVTKADANLPGGSCNGLLVGVAGTANLTFVDGTTASNVPLQLGYNPIAVLRVNTGGTATDIWALYN